jgi:GMP synthase (glutamine-hydrolysing)
LQDVVVKRAAWAIRHVEFEDLGVLHPLLYSRGYSVRYLEAPQGALDAVDLIEPDLLVVLGGPMGATDVHEHPFLRLEADALRRRRLLRRPSLGICLGAQLMAVSAGGDVQPMPLREIGLGPLELTTEGLHGCLAPLAGGDPVLHWHGDRIVLPPAATLLASTPACAVQAFTLDGPSLGLQFHLEADLERIGEWIGGHAAELAGTGQDAQALASAARGQAARVRELAVRVFGAWLDALPAPVR